MTPGERAYLAYWRAWPARALPFARLSQRERRAWEAVARALAETRQGRQEVRLALAQCEKHP